MANEEWASSKGDGLWKEEKRENKILFSSESVESILRNSRTDRC